MPPSFYYYYKKTTSTTTTTLSLSCLSLLAAFLLSFCSFFLCSLSYNVTAQKKGSIFFLHKTLWKYWFLLTLKPMASCTQSFQITLVCIFLFMGLCFAGDPFKFFNFEVSYIEASPLGVPQQVCFFRSLIFSVHMLIFFVVFLQNWFQIYGICDVKVSNFVLRVNVFWSLMPRF